MKLGKKVGGLGKKREREETGEEKGLRRTWGLGKKGAR